MEVVLVTTNDLKFEEMRRIIPNLIREKLKLPEIQANSLEEVVKEKIKYAINRLGSDRILIVDDTGLFLECFDFKLPGVFTSFFLSALGAERIFEISSCLNRIRAKAVTVLGLHDPNGNMSFFTGECEGILQKPQTDSFSNWNVLFCPIEGSKVFAEMSLEERSAYSMRAKASQKLCQYLKSNYA